MALLIIFLLPVIAMSQREQIRDLRPGEIVAVDNGDATDLESFQSTNRRAYNGLALVIVRSIKGKTGRIKLRATSEGLSGRGIELSAIW